MVDTMRETTAARRPATKSYVGSDDDWGYTHVLSETVWTLSDFLTQLAAEVSPHADGAEGFRRQQMLLAYAAELKAAAAAAHLDADDGAQCVARLAEIAADKARAAQHAARMAAAEQAGQNPPQLHA